MAAWPLAGLTACALVPALVLAALNASRLGTVRTGSDFLLAVAVGVGVATSQLIISRLPRNAIGWLLGLIELALAASMFTDQYALYGLATAPGSLPAARTAGWAAGVLATVTVLLLAFLVLLFPDGRLPSRRWRPVLWALVVVTLGWVGGQFQAGTTVTGGITDALSAAGITYPFHGLFPHQGWLSGTGRVGFVLGVAAGVLVVVSVFVRRRGASAERRRQLAWLGYVGLMTVIWAAALVVAGVAAPGAFNGSLGTLLWSFLVCTPVAGVPLACAVAVLKYRLYEIDRIISRTLAYAIVTGLLVGVYAGLVLLTTGMLRIHTPVAVAASTLAAAALFNPVRRRVQKAVDRRFNRARYDADQTIAAFAARLKDAVDLDSVQRRPDGCGGTRRWNPPTSRCGSGGVADDHHRGEHAGSGVPSSVAVGLLAGLVVMLLAGFVPLSIAARQLTLNDAWAASTMVIVIACAGVGVVVAGHQPRNPSAGSCSASRRAWGSALTAGFTRWPTTVSGTERCRWARRCCCSPRCGPRPWWLFGLVVLLFPDGRLASWRWRWVRARLPCCRRLLAAEHLRGDGPRHHRAQHPHHAQRRPFPDRPPGRECRLAALGRGGDPAASGGVLAGLPAAGCCPAGGARAASGGSS